MVSHAVCLDVRINVLVPKSSHSPNAGKRNRNGMWRGVGLADEFICSGFVTSPTDIYTSLVERISVTDKRVKH
jgi:hypothetical protein